MTEHRDQENATSRCASVISDETLKTEDEDHPSGIHRHLSKRAATTSPRDRPSRSSTVRKPWEIVEEFEHEGHRYRLQRRRIESRKEAPLAKREEETLELASEGMTRQQIAERLGLAPSTVGVLLHRASIKLRARSRNELISNYRELTERARTER